MRAAEEFAAYCDGRGLAKCSSKSQKELKNDALQKYGDLVVAAFGVLCSTEVAMAVAYSVPWRGIQRN